MGVNKFECRTCPYQYILDKAYYERTEMKRKEVADVLGGKDEWKNADSMAGVFSPRQQWKRQNLGQELWLTIGFYCYCLQYNVQVKAAKGIAHTSTSYRFEAPTSP